jgi:putative oxidoreductase
MARKFEPLDLVRVTVGIVFLTEGVLKFLHPGDLGVGRFARIGLPIPGFLAPFVGALEILGGLAMVLSVMAGWAALGLLGVITVALVTTKVPVLLGRPWGPFTLMKAPYYGILGFLHESRTDLAMLAGTLAVVWRRGLKG